LGLGLEGGLDGLAGQFACGRQRGGLDLGEHLPAGRVGGRTLKLMGYRQSLFEYQSLKWGCCPKRPRHDRASEAARLHYPGPDRPTTINYYTQYSPPRRMGSGMDRAKR
jgi:hypothetical protein